MTLDIPFLISFILVATGVIVIPGPNVLVIVSTSISHGISRDLQTVAGTSLAMAIQLLIAALGTQGLVQLLDEGFIVLKWLGVAYLIYIAARHLKQACLAQETRITLSSYATFARGFLVSLTNPKTILFFSALLPQFVWTKEHYLQQICILSIIFWSLAVVLDSCYALLSARLLPLLKQRRLSRLQDGMSGLLFLITGLWLALTDPQR